MEMVQLEVQVVVELVKQEDRAGLVPLIKAMQAVEVLLLVQVAVEEQVQLVLMDQDLKDLELVELAE
jgi:hypothetical protein